jgi:hypothetical protein
MVTSRATQSVLIFGAYVIFQGATLMLAPNLLLGILGLPLETSVWPRAVGWALIALGYYYVRNALVYDHGDFEWFSQNHPTSGSSVQCTANGFRSIRSNA